MSYNNSYDVIILAGGLSKRFGADKCCFEVNSKTMLDRLLEQFDNPIVVSRSPRRIKKGILVIEKGEYEGPVKGVREGLKYVRRDRVFITGCDFPFLIKNLVDYVCSKPYDIVIPFDHRPQPLLACYSTELLNKNIDKINGLVELIELSSSVYFIGTEELLKIDPFLYSLININSIIDLIYRPIRIKTKSNFILR
ncbi:molybdenum cofactor guanylyltransferase [Saccharolobus solfataricus]|uniref:Molybdopterin-guanine dinucleotide biosynthesis protein A (MobA) n=3 Tax=Saccharolobus solfataricus TaxID=2287 RepID=Q7LXN3_SACS2|nr:molybdenum cofactor guanylyltransferase [Saccharolobus solfataricus]AAK40979.1 Molybdopterin-guanine dinucleotide biosynthesis protein A (mobA) [Saccharolobus solfataricus P2]AKA74008.1 molybdenum cofactor guanylyltransferase [Saccharolobus solfataricus]AKA76705.1 molybdenum cofactor guanylyltransferase [Saccharolobus solfataricus]AKA79399.1 molybdenum cofactor guanylyltransferase [Saccharolobus solfataricus]AZF68486.1 molybdenum cofactor guanylyltransferase [Saccharolobus solfataricus]